MTRIRLDKFLAEMGIGTRSQVKNYIRGQAVSVNGEVIRQADVKVDPEQDLVEFQGQRVVYAALEYYMLNKPVGVVSAVTDAADPTVVELIETKRRKDLFPVGRLDKDTEGLLLITNDGILANRLLSPKKHVEKVYYARIEGYVTDHEVARFAEGLDIGEEKFTLPAQLTILASGPRSEITLAITEGKFHQVKRMFHSVGMEVLYLKRISMGSLILDPALEPGEYRKLTQEELQMLQKPKDSSYRT